MMIKIIIFFIFVFIIFFPICFSYSSLPRYCQPDFNRDGVVDTHDWPIFRDAFGHALPSGCNEILQKQEIYSARYLEMYEDWKISHKKWLLERYGNLDILNERLDSNLIEGASMLDEYIIYYEDWEDAYTDWKEGYEEWEQYQYEDPNDPDTSLDSNDDI